MAKIKTKDIAKIAEDVNKRVFYHFRRISKIPRGSGNERAIADWLVDFAKLHGLEFKRSYERVGKKQTHNVVIFKPASKGYEKCKTVILQGHMDMVCEKVETSDHNFLIDPIEIIEDVDEKGNKIMTANGTTLGADDGIGVAMALAILERDDLAHPAINALFTSDEEAGMSGAATVNEALLDGVDNKCLINIDTEEEGAFYNGCAGGIDVNFEMEAESIDFPKEYSLFEIKISGLQGGHSGVEIHLGRANAHKLMVRTLRAIKDEFKTDLRLIKIIGGTMRNAITRECSAVVAVECENTDNVKKLIKGQKDAFKKEFIKSETSLEMTADEVPAGTHKAALSKEATETFINVVLALPNDVIEWRDEGKKLVETSANIGYVSQTSKQVLFSSFVRSFTRDEKLEVVDAMKVAVKKNSIGATKINISTEHDSPSWDPDPSSDLLKRFKSTYISLFDKEAVVRTIHAGLECGYFAEKFPGMDMISCGPTLKWVHTPDEKMYVDTVIKVTKLLLRVLEDMNKEVAVADAEANGTMYEDVIIVRNDLSLVMIKDVEITGGMEFELFHDGKWVKGVRQNSNYGQIFVGKGLTEIIVSGESRGRIFIA